MNTVVDILAPEAWDKLEDLMIRQLELLEVFASQEGQLRSHLATRDWQGLQKTLISLEENSRRVAALETARHNLWWQILTDSGLDPDTHFYQGLTCINPPDRDRIASVYRSLKLKLLMIQSMTEGIGDFTRTALDAAREIIHDIQPHQKGKIYSRAGRLREGDAAPLVFSQEL